jgi:D-methionine transport system substrate-binding protein
MKKIISILTTIFVIAAVLTGCGAKKTTDNSKVIKIGATSNPHAIILEKIKPVLEKEGYTLEITVFDDYALLNPALANGELDANFFQHIPYLDEYNKSKNTNLVAVQKVHIEPMGIYSKTLKNVNDIKAGSEITIPADPSNGSRALKLLAKAGLITVPDKEILKVQDISGNTKNLKITEVEAKQLPNTLQDVALSVINSNYALEAKLNPVTDSLFTESGDSPYANVIAVNKGHENDAKIQALVKAITTPDVKQFILDQFKGAVVPAF